jgi:hypothetical protein
LEKPLANYLESFIKSALNQIELSCELNFEKRGNNSIKTSQINRNSLISRTSNQSVPHPEAFSQHAQHPTPQQLTPRQSASLQKSPDLFKPATNNVVSNDSVVPSQQPNFKAPSNEAAKAIIDNSLLNINSSQMRGNMNEKRLLVKLIKATNLASKFNSSNH